MSGWDPKLLAPSSPHVPLLQQVHALFEQQRTGWSMFRDGEAALAGMKIKELSMDNARVIVQANPGRGISTNARVDPVSVARRPCFLCPESLPPQERGVAFGDYVLLPNPYPIVKQHMTIAFRGHVPQRIEGRIDDLCALAKALGPEMFVIYNGPRCGASAPDHMHFQACSSEGVPLFEDVPVDSGSDQVVPRTVWGRNMLVCSVGRAREARARVESVISALKDITAGSGEPMVNIVALYRGDRYMISIFPRAKHRSTCYFAGPQQQISISPAAMEMAGLVVVANSGHFDRVDETVVRSIFEEVTLGNDLFLRLVEAVT